MKILVVSPHPDDETLGAGGTLLKLKSEGHSISWLNITTAKGNALFSEEFLEKRTAQIDKICNLYEFDNYISLDFPTAKLDEIGDSNAIEKISVAIKSLKPDVLVIPDINDVHSDHKKVHEWCIACSKSFRCPFIKYILSMEILSETEFGYGFQPNIYVDISEYIDKKIEALNIYESEVHKMPFPRSEEAVKALATFRGVSSGYSYAEAFRLIKGII